MLPVDWCTLHPPGLHWGQESADWDDVGNVPKFICNNYFSMWGKCHQRVPTQRLTTDSSRFENSIQMSRWKGRHCMDCCQVRYWQWWCLLYLLWWDGAGELLPVGGVCKNNFCCQDGSYMPHTHCVIDIGYTSHILLIHSFLHEPLI
jgi:hypothetical protein